MQAIAVSVLSSLAASGALSAALYFLLQNWISERLKNSIKHEYDLKIEYHKAQLQASFNVEIETMKARLQAENAVAVEKLKADLQIASMERQIRFSKIQDRVVDSVSEMYSRLSEFMIAVGKYTSAFESPSMGTKEERRLAMAKKLEEFDEYFKIHRLYLSRDLAAKTRRVVDMLYKLSVDFMFGVEKGRDELYSDRETWAKVINSMDSDVKPIYEEIETEFRQMIGSN